MKNITLLVYCTIVSLLSYTSAGLAATSPEVVPIVGAFKVQVTLRTLSPDCTSGQIIESDFGTMYSLNSGGTMNEYGMKVPPAQRTPGFGVWKRVESDLVATQYTFQVYDGNGFPALSIDVTGAMRLTDGGNKIIGVARYDSTDVSGNSFSTCATIDGERIKF